jgi:hypothetical protein
MWIAEGIGMGLRVFREELLPIESITNTLSTLRWPQSRPDDLLLVKFP